MMHRHFQKTDKGREEIATRRHGLSLRLRSILLLIDGKKSGEDLLRAYPGLGLTEALLADLEKQRFITTLTDAQPQLAQTAAALRDPEARENGTQLSISIAVAESQAPKSNPVTLFLNTIFPDGELSVRGEPVEDGLLTAKEDGIQRPTLAKPLEEHATLFEALKACYLNGLRTLPPPASAPLVRAVGNAQTLKALADLSGSYREALRAAKGNQAAAQFEQELDLLLFACEN